MPLLLISSNHTHAPADAQDNTAEFMATLEATAAASRRQMREGPADAGSLGAAAAGEMHIRCVVSLGAAQTMDSGCICLRSCFPRHPLQILLVQLALWLARGGSYPNQVHGVAHRVVVTYSRFLPFLQAPYVSNIR
jgi:hypothetical protein